MLKNLYEILIFPYALGMLYFMFIGMGRYQYDFNIVRIIPIYSTITYFENSYVFKRDIGIVLGNLVMFMPFGFLGWVLPKLKDLKELLINFVSVIVIIEAIQYFTRLGVFDVDDIIINTLGVYLGYLLCGVVERKLSSLVFTEK